MRRINHAILRNEPICKPVCKRCKYFCILVMCLKLREAPNGFVFENEPILRGSFKGFGCRRDDFLGVFRTLLRNWSRGLVNEDASSGDAAYNSQLQEAENVCGNLRFGGKAFILLLVG